MTIRKALFTLASLAALGVSAGAAAAAEEIEVSISIKDNKFDPTEIKVPAGKAVKLTIKNLDTTPEEFESNVLKIEKVIGGNATGVVRLKPMEKGSYPFVGEFHEATAKGTIVVD